MEVAPTALLTILTLLVSSRCLRHMLIGLPLIVLAVGYRSSARVGYSLSAVVGLAARKVIRINLRRGRDRWKILEHCLLNCGGLRSDFGAQARIALRCVALGCLEHGREVTVAVEEVWALLRRLCGRRRS